MRKNTCMERNRVRVGRSINGKSLRAVILRVCSTWKNRKETTKE